MPDPVIPESFRRDSVFNGIALVVLILAGLFVVWTVGIFLNPYSAINPFPPSISPGAPTKTISISARSTLSITPTAETAAPTPTSTQAAQDTPIPTPSATILPAFSPTPTSAFPFLLSAAGIRPTVAFQGCAWQGVAGQVFDPLGIPIPNLPVHVEGKLDGRPLSMEMITSTLPAYGAGAFEFMLGEIPVPSDRTIWIQLLDSAKKAISDRVLLITYEGCDRNLLIVDFQQVTP
jgi:hypothetical protein